MPTLRWLRDNYRLPDKGADNPGPYNPDYVPYLWGIFYALDAPNVPLVVMMKAAQIGWTFGLVGYIGQRIDTQPSAILLIFPTLGAAREFSDEKLVPAIEATPVLRDKIDVSTSRSSGNRALFKNFPGGFLKLGGSNSTASVKSTPAPLVIVEEPDDTADNVKDQGDAIRLAKERLKRFRNGKMVLGGTPSISGLSRVEEQVNLSTQRVLPITCHDCGSQHVLDWDNVTWLDADAGTPHPVYGMAQPDTALYCCPHCGVAWDDWQRQQNIIKTVKDAHAAGDPFCGWVATVENSGGAEGFKELSELYVCIPGTSLADVVRDYLEAEHDAANGDESGRIVFRNSKLARPYVYNTSSFSTDELEARAEDYDEMTVPERALALTAGIDVQHDRLAIAIWAWGPGEEMWLVYWGEIYAKENINDKNDPVWLELDKFLFTPIPHALGFNLRILQSAIDSSDGATSDAVYSYVRTRQHKGVIAVKGSSNDYGTKEIYSKPKAVDYKSKTKASKKGVQVYIVGTHKAKDLLIGDKGRLTLSGNGPGRMHWYESVRPDFYVQLLSEIKAPSKRTRKMAYQLRAGVRNEALDCTVMATHASRAAKLHLKTPAQWADLEKSLRQVDLFSNTETETDVKPAANRTRSNARRGGFANNWRK
ncbi:MAG: phage terminase large subunit family protein [Rhodospirillaceae bacterium]|nr:phage terminase large subunit family protein [Rhodospirillaceae bacterium]